MFLFAIRAYCGQANCGHPGGKEPEEDGRRWSFWPLREDCFNAERQEAKEEENVHKEVYTQSILQRIIHIRGSLRADTGVLSAIGYSFEK